MAVKQIVRKVEIRMEREIAAAVLGCTVLLMAGCSGTGRIEPKEQVIHLSVLAGQSTSDAGIEEMIDEKLAEAIPNVKLDWECVDWGESFNEELNARFAAGDIPDILIGKAQDAGYYSATGNLAPIDERFVEDLDKMARESVTIDGIAYGIPYNYWYQGVIYNKDIFAQYGLEAPETREELETIVETLEAGGETPFAGHYQENWTVGNITMQLMLNNIFANYPFWGDDFRKGKVNYTGNEMVEDCMESSRYMFNHTWEDAMLIDQAVCDSRFEQRGAAMYLTGSWSLQFSNLYQQADYYGIFPYPNLTGDAKLIRETNMTFMKSSVTEYGEAVDRIFELLMTDEELMGEILDYTQTFSVKKDYKANFKSCLQEELDSYEEKGQIIEANNGNTQLFWQFQNDVAEQELLWLRGNQELSDVLEYADAHRMESGI